MTGSVKFKLGPWTTFLSELTPKGIATLFSVALRAHEEERLQEGGPPRIKKGELWTDGIEQLLDGLPEVISSDRERLHNYASSETPPYWPANCFELARGEFAKGELDDYPNDVLSRLLWTQALLEYAQDNEALVMELKEWARAKVPSLRQRIKDNAKRTNAKLGGEDTPERCPVLYAAARAPGNEQLPV